MARTVIEKIIQSHSPEEAVPGRIVWMDLDVRSARDFGGPNVVKNYEREYGSESVADPAKTVFTFDLCAPACTLKYADNQQICRDFARARGLRVYDVDQGIGSHVLMEQGLARAGGTAVGTDSHMNILGAIGCFGQGMGDVDITYAFRTGRTWFEVPESVKVVVKGAPSPRATAKDLTLYLCKVLGTSKIALRSAEFYGPAVASLDLAGRITLCSMVTEMAGIIGFVPEDPRNQAGTLSIAADPGAVYAETIEVDIDGLEPQLAVPPSPNTVRPVSEVRGIKIDSGFIGSCTNGRAEDMAAAAAVLRGRKIKPGVMLKIVPATRWVYDEMLQTGLLKMLFESGAIVLNPGCGGCAEGHAGLTGKGEVEVSTGNRNFPGKQGKGPVYLASPETVVASCLAGEIVSAGEV